MKKLQLGGDLRSTEAIIKDFFDNSLVNAKLWNELSLGGKNYLIDLCEGKENKDIIFENINISKNEKSNPYVSIISKPKLPNISNKDYRPGRKKLAHNQTKQMFSEYNVYMAGNNCALNALDTLRKDAIRILEQNKNELGKGELLKFINESRGEGENFYAALLPYIGRYLLGANVNVFQEGENQLWSIFHPWSPEYLAPDPTLPTLNLLWEGVHFHILVPEENSEEVNLLRDYAKIKESLAYQAEDLLGGDFTNEDYARATNMQFLNNGLGGWLIDYIKWVKSLQKK